MIFGINTSSDISKLLYIISRAVKGEWNLRQFWNITSGIYGKYHVQIMLLIVYTTALRRFVIFTCRYFKLSWNTTALSQSNCRNFSFSSIIFEVSCHTHPTRAKRFTEMCLFSIFRMNMKIKRIVEQDSRERFFLEPEVICNLSVIFKRVVGGFNSQWTVISRYKQGSISLIILWSYLLFVYKLFFFLTSLV